MVYNALYHVEGINPKIFADLYNRGFTINEIAKKFNLSTSSLSRRLDKWLREGCLMYYYNVELHKIDIPISICILAFNQRMDVLRKIRMIKPIAVFYTPIPRSTYIVYFEGECHDISKVFLTELQKNSYKIVLCGRIENSPFIFEKYREYDLQLIFDTGDEYARDDIDRFIMETYFSLFNPPSTGRIYKSLIMEIMRRYVGVNIYRNHYYRHLYNKIIRRRIIYREIDKLEYAILTLYTKNYMGARNILLELYRLNIIGGVDQISVISSDPFIAVSHLWINKDNLWYEKLVHKYFENSKYEIYIVKKIV